MVRREGREMIPEEEEFLDGWKDEGAVDYQSRMGRLVCYRDISMPLCHMTRLEDSSVLSLITAEDLIVHPSSPAI